ncbi:hypothetical protein ACFSZS_12395 [Seohaeicola zhoushanensis]
MAAIFRDANMASDALYHPGGSGSVAIRIIPARPDETVEFGGATGSSARLSRSMSRRPR